MPTYIPDRDELEMHYANMEGGDDTLAYTETGEIVIPNEVQKRFPQIAAAALQAIAQSGGNPAQYVVGSPMGNYDMDTNAQQFAWYDDLWEATKNATKATADYVANSNVGKSLVTGVGTAAAAKLAGADTTQALATGAGAGLGYLGGASLGQGIANLTDNNDATGFFDTPEVPKVTSATTSEALMNAAKSFNMAGLTGAATGGLAGFTMGAPIPQPTVDLQLNKDSQLEMPKIAPMPDPFDLEDNDKPNVSATLPQTNPIAPMTPAALKPASGIRYLDKVKDRDTGRYRFMESDKQDDSAFARAISGASRRRGFGSKIFSI